MPSSFMKTGEKIFELLDKFVECIGEKNVVQVITDNGSNYVLAGKILFDVLQDLFVPFELKHYIMNLRYYS